MTNLRIQKKTANRAIMLETAKQLFIERGYSKTNMEDIAEAAGFGVATLYTYFKTKEGVFAAMAKNDMSELKAEGEEALTCLPSDPVQALLVLFHIYAKVYDYVPYAVVRDFVLNSKSAGPIHDVAVWADEWQMDQVARALKLCQKKGVLDRNLDAMLAAAMIVVLIRHRNNQTVEGPKTGKRLVNLKPALNLLLKGWLTTSGECADN